LCSPPSSAGEPLAELLVWNLVHGGMPDWRPDRGVLRAHDVATLAAAVVIWAWRRSSKRLLPST
jgi:hypothetical protein